MMLRLLDHLRRENAAFVALTETLQAEYQAMQDGDFEALPALTETKRQTLVQLAVLDAQREKEQQALGHSLDRAGADAMAAAGGLALQNAWQQLQQSARAARDLNHRNGLLVHTHLDFTRQAIGFLKPGSQSLYGPDGAHSRHGGAGQALGRG